MSVTSSHKPTRSAASVWRDVVVKDDKEWCKVGPQLNLHELQVKALSRHDNRPQALQSDGQLLINFQVPSLEHNNLKIHRLSVVITKKEVLTLHESDFELLEDISDRVLASRERRSSPTGVLSVIADIVTEQFGPILDYVDTKIDKLEDTMIDKPDKTQLNSLFSLKQLLVQLRRVVTPTASMLNGMIDGRYDLIETKYAPYFRDCYDYTWRSHELIDTLRDLLSSSLDTYLSVASNRLNEVMKRLTIIATIFLPLSFVVGLGGINFKQFPFTHDEVYAVMMISLVAMPVLMLVYFKIKKWM